MTNYTVLLYYKYVAIENPENLRQEQEQICQELGLKGRIIVAGEGINGTLEGEGENVEKYCQNLMQMPEFKDINFKKSTGNGQAFSKLSVKVRSEIVSTHLSENIDPNQVTGKYLSAEELHDWFLEKREFFIIDMRNDYEHKSGFLKIPFCQKN